MTCQLKLGGGSINKQQYIIQTLTFIANSIFINIFAKIFGMSNSIVAVSIVVIALSLVVIDLRENIVKKTLYISIVMLALGVGATFVNVNPILGLVINLLIIFFIVYEGINTYKENMYFPFLLAYIFMALSAPANPKDLPLRMISIVIGCVYILIIQLVLNKDRFNKTVFHTKKQLIAMVINQVDCVLEGTCQTSSVEAIYPLTKPIVKAIYDTRLKGKAISTENKGKLLLVLSIENLYRALCDFSDKVSLESVEREFLSDIRSLLKNIDNYFYTNKNKELIKKQILFDIDSLNRFIEYENFKSILEIIKELPQAIEWIENGHKNVTHKEQHLKNIFKPIEFHSVNFKFSLKLTLTISIIVFLADVFNITYGRWIIFPVIAIIQPYMNGTVKKAVERVIGTVLGIIMFVIIFTLVSDNMVRLNITIFIAYINLFMRKYYISTSLIAISALGSAAMGGAGIEILILRITLTIVGCIIGLIVNKYIFSYTLDEYTRELEKEYKAYIKELNESDSTVLHETKKYDLILKSRLLKYKIAQTIKN